MKVNIIELIKNQYTYPSWATSSCYELEAQEIDNKFVKIYYLIDKHIKRKIERTFSKELTITPRFAFVLGLIDGEGANKLGKSNYRRFTFTNTDPELIKIVLDELGQHEILDITNLPNKSFHIIHSKRSKKETLLFWSKSLNIDIGKIRFVNGESGNSEYGVCHLYLSDVLLRRIIDLLKDKIKISPSIPLSD